jgi:hypothetical protein
MSARITQALIDEKGISIRRRCVGTDARIELYHLRPQRPAVGFRGQHQAKPMQD